MTLNNFEKTFPENRLRNGKIYFNNGKVTSLEEDKDGDWYATVVGTDEYDVEIILDGNKICETSCDCPAFNEFTMCKHVAAVLYAINEEINGEPEYDDDDDDDEVAIPEKILTLLEELRPDELRMFLKVSMKGNRKLMRSLEISSDYFLLRRGTKDLATELSEKIKKYVKDGIIAKKQVPAVVNLTAAYVDAATAHWKKNEAKEALDHLLAVTDVLAFESEFMEDEKGTHRSVVLSAFQLIDEIAKKKKINKSMRELLVDYAFEGAVDPNMPVAEYEMHWLDLICKHDLAKEKETEYIEILDEQLESCTGRGQQATHSRLLRLKIDFLSRNDKKAQAMKIIESNPDLANEKEQLLLSASKKTGEYWIIKQKMLAALELAKVNGDKKEYNRLQNSVIDLLESKSDVLDVRKLSERFYRETGNQRFFEAMKGTYVKTEWEKIKDKFQKPGNPLRKV